MNKPTDEQKKELWEYFGKHTYWTYENGWDNFPPIDLNNLFKYAVPKVYEDLGRKGESYKFDRIWDAIERALLDKEDVGTAVFWAIYSVITGKERYE